MRKDSGAGGLRGRLVRAGLEPLRVTYLNALLLPLAAAKRLAERLTGGRYVDVQIDRAAAARHGIRLDAYVEIDNGAGRRVDLTFRALVEDTET